MAKGKKKKYADQPKAPSSKVADKPLVQNASLGNDMPSVPFVPTPPSVGKPPIGKSAKAPPSKHLRLSGHSGAHQLGKKK